MNPIPHAEVFARLADYIPDDQVRRRDTGRGGVQLYVKAQTVMNRLDEVLGPAGWWDHYERLDELTVECALTVRLPDGSTLTKRDVGIRKPVAEGGKLDPGCSWKAAYSDALKRAASKFGVARHLCRCGFASFVGPTLAGLPHGEDSTPVDSPHSRESLPSQARPPHAPEPEPSRRPERRRDRGHDRPRAPKNGRALWAWAKDHDDRDAVGLVEHLTRWGKLQGLPGKFLEWDSEAVSRGYEEGVRMLQSAAELEGATA